MTYSRRKQRRHRKKSLRYKKRGGGCGCSKSNTLFGGSNNLGPSPGLDQLPIRSYYDLNSYNNDPSSSSAIQSTRTLPNMMVGGRKMHKRSKSRRSRKSMKRRLMRGGGLLDGYSILGTDAISNFGNSSGAFNSSDLLHGNVSSNSNPSIQPITTMFNSNNPQMV